MSSLKSNLLKRIERFPKPKSTADSLQPLFEAISNSIHSTLDKYGNKVSKHGLVTIEIEFDKKKNTIVLSVEDNGHGLNSKNYEAFTTTDTDHKIKIGGKGVGRLLWLDCFNKIEISSRFMCNGNLVEKTFGFKLRQSNQIIDENNSPVKSATLKENFKVRFEGFRSPEYSKKFPFKAEQILQHITSHFLPTFISKMSPKVAVYINGAAKYFPKEIRKIITRTEDIININEFEEYGEMSLTLMECEKVASANLKGVHFVHFIAHDRTVHTQCIDAKLGFKLFGKEEDKVFHAILRGKFLDDNVNQERTSFTFEDAHLKKMVNNVCFPLVEIFLEEPIRLQKDRQTGVIKQITNTYPSVNFGSVEELQDKVPAGELVNDVIYGILSREKYRRDDKLSVKLKQIMQKMKSSNTDYNDFETELKSTRERIGLAQQGSLAEYVLRRKVVLDFVEMLLEKVRLDTKDSSYQREDVLHSMICPMRTNTVAEDATNQTPTSHDLWMIDERLTYVKYYSSDEEFKKISPSYDSRERADVIIFDKVRGFRDKEDPSRLVLIEFKRPGRDEYPDAENPIEQIKRYINLLKGGDLKTIKGRPIKLTENTIFDCFLIADIIGKVDTWTADWAKTPNERGRIYEFKSGHRGSIEVIGWDDLISDARFRNQAFFDQMGLSGQSIFSFEEDL